ncbi:lamin tail domain-containing protein [Candidatus Woesearchaeota archaeon]|nr:lamin tail domain-containing protein [Candidatus Woesearchaeota archaeon]
MNLNKQMKLAILAIMLFLSGRQVFSVPDHVIINQVLYDPIGSETGGEAIELYNPTSVSINISGWVVKTASSATDAVLGNNVVLEPAQYYLIADAGWSSAKDNASWPAADHEEPITLANTNSGIALLQGSTIVDAVGWGDSALIAPDLFEGTPAPQVIPGQALRRVLFADSNNNSADFLAFIPDFHSSAGTNVTSGNDSGSGSNISLTLTVTNSLPQIDQLTPSPDEDAFFPGIQILPFPGGNTTVNMTVKVSDVNQQDTITSVRGILQPFGRTFILNKTAVLNATTALFQGMTYLQFFEASQNYSISVNVTDDANASSSASATFQYGSVTAVELEMTTLSFGALTAGATTAILGDALFTTAAQPTIRNIGNSRINLGVKGSGLGSGSTSIPASNVRYSFDGSFTSNVSGTLSNALSLKPTNIDAGVASYVPLSLELVVPLGTKTGLFNGQLMLVAASS